MKKFFFSHPDFILATIAVVLLVILVGFFSWAINDVVSEVHQSTATAVPGDQQQFDLQDAASLDLRGLSTSTASSSLTTPAASTSSIIVAPTSTASSSAQ